MSALQRTRSRSTTAPATGADTAPPNGMSSVVDSDRPGPSSTPSPSRVAAQRAASTPRHATPLKSETTTLKHLPIARPPTKSALLAGVVDNKKDLDEDQPDNRSSSLSELGDGSEGHDEPTPRPLVAHEFAENDSEAETERLENTPRKLTRTATDISIASDRTVERTPSKLAHSNIPDHDDSTPQSPLGSVHPSLVDPLNSGSTREKSAEPELGSVAELTGRKRKRSTTENSSVEDPVGAPARKRSSTAKSAAINGNPATTDHNPEQVDIEDELDHAEERIAELAQEDHELEAQQADIAAETVNELTTVARLPKQKQGRGRKGKRKAEAADTNNENIAHPESMDIDMEADHDDDDSSTLDEEVAKKKGAIETLSRIEKRFRIFREKVCDEQLAQFERELEMLKQPNCTHPEYLNMVRCIDERRAEKIECERTLLAYKQKCLEIRTIAERQQMHSQYIQAVREIREKVISECNQRVYELQRSRRQLGVEEVDYSFKYPEKRSEQIRQQIAYNSEVGILAGVAKYVGFPAAPDMAPARASDIDDDLRAMKITTRQPHPLPYVRHYNRTSTADEAAAEEQFIERTPWANPHHPAHQQAHYPVVSAGPSRAPVQSYHTPAGQRRVVDIHATNGSASTIDMMSNPPSSTAAQGPSLTEANRQQSESPVMRMKRHPNDNRVQSETPGSQPRNYSSLAREAYPHGQHVGSSPATGHPEPHHQEYDGHAAPMGGRWTGSGVRPLNAAPPSIPPGASIPGRPEAGRIPLAQRGNLGAVGIASGAGLFGR